MVLTIVNNTSDACITGVIGTGEAHISGINDTGKVVVRYWPLPTTLVTHDLTGMTLVMHASLVSFIPNLLDTELDRNQTSQIPNLSDTNFIKN
jgi:hypothetical protein